jgi:hypothetical protein
LQDLGLTAWAVGKLRARPHASWTNLLLDATELALPACNARDLGHMLLGMSEVGGRSGRGLGCASQGRGWVRRSRRTAVPKGDAMPPPPGRSSPLPALRAATRL